MKSPVGRGGRRPSKRGRGRSGKGVDAPAEDASEAGPDARPSRGSGRGRGRQRGSGRGRGKPVDACEETTVNMSGRLLGQ